MIFIKESNGSWWELNKDKMEVFSFGGGFHNISDEQLRSLEACECDNWHDLFVLTGWCPLEVNIRWSNVWISPNGEFFNGDAHDNRAEDILEIIYEEEDVDWPGDRLEEIGWIRTTTSSMISSVKSGKRKMQDNSYFKSYKDFNEEEQEKIKEKFQEYFK